MRTMREPIPYREMVYRLCSEADLDDKKDVLALVKFLASEAVQAHEVNRRFEDKLKELMTYKDFTEMSMEIAKEMFKQDVEAMPEGDFKDFITENMGDILGEDEKGENDGHDGMRSEEGR